MKANRNNVSRRNESLLPILLALWMLLGSQAFAQQGSAIPKTALAPARATAPTAGVQAAVAEATSLSRLASEMSEVPIALESAGISLGQLQFELAQIPPHMVLDTELELGLSGHSVAPVALAQAAAEVSSAGYASAALSLPSFEHGWFGQDAPVVAGQKSGADAKAYQKAYDLVLDKKWIEAQKELDGFIAKYRNSSYSDAARYWRCYTQEKTGSPNEEAFKKYQEFVKSYPHSRWADDATTNMIRIGSELARQGKSEYGTIVQSLQQGDDEDVKLTALYALRSNTDEKSLPVIMNLYDHSKSEKMREKIVYVLGSFDSPQIVPKLIDIALKDPSMSVRKNAVYALGNTKKSEASASLKQIVKSQAEPEIRTAALYALANVGDQDLIPYLVEIAKNDPNDKLARSAAYSIANVNSDESTKALQTLLKEAKSKEVRKAALYSLGNRGDAAAVVTLKEIALNETDVDMSRQATFALGNIHSKPSFEALTSIVSSAKDAKVKEAAVQAIGNNTGKESREFLKKLALTDPDDNIARMAVWSVGNSHEGSDDSDANFYLEVLHNAKSFEVKKAALYQFANTNKSSAVKSLSQFVKEEKDPDLRIAAIYVLGNTKSDDAVDVLLGIARTDATKKARTAAVSALSNIETKKAQDALLEILEGKTKE